MPACRIILSLGIAVFIAIAGSPLGHARRADNPQPSSSRSGGDTNRLVYADFERVVDGRPVSARGGFINLFGYQEHPTLPSRFQGLEGVEPAAPMLVRVKPDDPNRLAKFDVEFQMPNQWAGVTLEIRGLPDAEDGRPGADDVSGYKQLSMDLFAKGIETMRVELISRGHGITTQAYPQATLRPREGLNTYKLPLRQLAQPQWVEQRVDTRQVLRNLTSIAISAYCDTCRATKGMVIIDNVVFEK